LEKQFLPAVATDFLKQKVSMINPAVLCRVKFLQKTDKSTNQSKPQIQFSTNQSKSQIQFSTCQSKPQIQFSTCQSK
jgi:hypothetical protein